MMNRELRRAAFATGIALSMGATSCSTTGDEQLPSGDSPELEQPTEAPQKEGPAEVFGAALLRGITAVPFEELVVAPDAYPSETIETEGVVRANCQKRGCWMEIRSPYDTASAAITVRFVDYGFFVPLDSRGALVRIQGTIAVDELTEEEVEDLVSEGHDTGIVQPDGTAKVVTFTANGVEMWNRDK